MSRFKSIEGEIEPAGMGYWRIGKTLLKGGTVTELRLSGGWLLGLLQSSPCAMCRFFSWEDGVEITLRPGLRVRAFYFQD